jgi:hypothetical protein
VSILLHGIVYVIPDDPRGPQAPIRKHGVGRDINVDLVALQAMLLKELSVVLRNLIPIASLHEGILQQQREVVTMQTPHAQPIILKGAVRVISHLRQDFWKIRIYDERYSSSTSKAIEKDNKGGD